MRKCHGGLIFCDVARPRYNGHGNEKKPRDTIQGIYNIVRVTFPPCIMNQSFKISQCPVSLQP